MVFSLPKNSTSENVLSQNDEVKNLKLPTHLAVIMDGNGRWARSRLLPRIEGHRSGAKTVRMIVEECRKLNIKYLTLFTFSAENWKRPEKEVSSLMSLFKQYLLSELDLLKKHGIKLRAIGNLDRLPPGVKDVLKHAESSTKDMVHMELILAISYSGREEIINATRNIAQKVKSGEIDANEITENLFCQNLYAGDIPDPDLLIRTSNEFRISNFLLWQLAYAEIVVSDKMWPAFDKKEFIKCLGIYSGRNRRFGMIDEQVDQERLNLTVAAS